MMRRLPHPRIAPSAFVHPRACVEGDVAIDPGCSLWPGAVLRGDQNAIRLGRNTNVQDNAVLHASRTHSCTIGSQVSIGHGAVVHGCTVKDRVIVGMHASVLDGAVIGHDCLIGAGAVVPPGMRIPPRSLVVGVPAKVSRPLSSREIRGLQANAETYLRLAALRRQAYAAR